MEKEFSRNTVDKAKNICEYLGVPVVEYSSPNSRELFDICERAFKRESLQYGFTLHGSFENSNDEAVCVCYNDSMPERVQAVVLLHELGHVLMEQWEKPQEQRKKIGEIEQGEFFAEMFACIMTALSVANINTKAVKA